MSKHRQCTNTFFVVALVVYTIQGVGGTDGVEVRLTNQDHPVSYLDYYDVSEENPYILECDPGVELVNGTIISWWLKGFKEVYKWESTSGKVYIDDFLVKGVRAPEEESTSTKPYNIEFLNPTPAMIGVYTCKVSKPDSANLEKEFILNMYALPSSRTEYIFHARVEDCMIYWSFETPSMYPKPNITCGYWNQTAEAFDQVIQGGMIFRQFSNLTWAAFMTETAIKINVVPHGLSLRCENNIEIANYSRVFELDHNDPPSEEAFIALQARGCPRFTATEYMILEQPHCHHNCRDECQPPREGDDTHVQVFCPKSWKAYHYHNDSFTYPFRLSVNCEYGSHIWTTSDTAEPINDTQLPICVPWNTGGSRGISKEIMPLYLILSLPIILINYSCFILNLL